MTLTTPDDDSLLHPHTKKTTTPPKKDIYVFCCSFAHAVAPQGKWLAFVSTTVETDSPEAELAPGLALLGPVDEKFVTVSEVRAPLGDGAADKCFISAGYDPTTHFETTVDDVLALYQRITGKPLDLNTKNPRLAEQAAAEAE